MPSAKRPCTSLGATISMQGCLTRTFPWTICKSVEPETICVQPGGTEKAVFTVAVEKGEGVDGAFVKGQVCIWNKGAACTEDLRVKVKLSAPPRRQTISSTVVDLSEHPVLGPGEICCYEYRLDIPSDCTFPGKIYKVTADVTITNHWGRVGTPYGPCPCATTILAVRPVPVNNCIHVDDSSGDCRIFCEDGVWCYNRYFRCSDAGTKTNTAVIRETGDVAEAAVMVVCQDAPPPERKTVLVSAQVTVTPHVLAGETRTRCMGDPIFEPVCGVPQESCSIEVRQRIQVSIPLVFSAAAEAVPSGIICPVEPLTEDE